jgi:hypothetical protein
MDAGMARATRVAVTVRCAISLLIAPAGVAAFGTGAPKTATRSEEET